MEVVCLRNTEPNNAKETRQAHAVQHELHNRLRHVHYVLGVEHEGDAHAQASGALEHAGVAGAADRIVGQGREGPLDHDPVGCIDDAEEEVEDSAGGEAGVGPVDAGRGVLLSVDVVLFDPGG